MILLWNWILLFINLFNNSIELKFYCYWLSNGLQSVKFLIWKLRTDQIKWLRKKKKKKKWAFGFERFDLFGADLCVGFSNVRNG